MKRFFATYAPFSLACFVLTMTVTHADHPTGTNTTMTHSAAMLTPWQGPFGGVPPWDKVDVAQFVSAFDRAMDEQRKEIAAIANNPEAASFDNTIVAMERSGETLDRLHALYGVYVGTLNTGEMPVIQKILAPKFAAFADERIQNQALFNRIEAVYNSPDKHKLSAEAQRLIWLYHTNFVRAGAKLNHQQKQRISHVNSRLASTFTQFSQNVLDDETTVFTVIESADDLAGVPDDMLAAYAAAAEKHGLKGQWVIDNTRSAVEPFLTMAHSRPWREKVWTAFVNRGDNGGKSDNNALISEILQLRFERAQLLGYPTHAHWRLEQQMAKNPENAVKLMEAVWQPAAAAVKRDVADMQALIDQQGEKFKLAPWDYRYYAEQLRKAKYDLDMNEVKPYLQLDNLREGMFWAAGKLYGFYFSRLQNIPVQHPDVTVYEVKNAEGKHIGLWYFDPYARRGKRSGAWMNAYRGQQHLDANITTIVSNNSNFVKGKDGEPVLISWEDARTLFHEFGHALHGLSSAVTYPTLAGTAVARDFVEFPSQINEHWLATPEILNRFALHYQSGKPIPQGLVEKIQRAETFNEGFRTMEYLASAMIDMKLHLAGGRTIDPDQFEREELNRLGLPAEIVMRHRTPHFLHVFSSDGYSAGYYAYLWADSLTADAWNAFEEGKGPWDADVARRFQHLILSLGNTVDPADAFRQFRGRDVRIDALMRKRGFMLAPTSPSP